MFKKVLLVCSVLFCLIFFGLARECFAGAKAQLEQAKAHQKNGDCRQAEAAYKAIAKDYPGTGYALQAQKKLVMLYKHDQPQAKAAFQKLVADFSTHELLPEAVYEIAQHYSETQSWEKFEMANQFHQYFVDNWPTHEYAMLALSGLAISNIHLGNNAAAQAAVERLVADFSDNEHIAKAVYDVAHRYNGVGKKAEQLYQRVIDNWPEAKHAMWEQINPAHTNISSGNDADAKAVIDKLTAHLSKSEFIGGVLYDIAAHYGRLGKYKKAKQYYQYVVNNRPENAYAMWSQMNVTMLDISLGDEASAKAAIDKLVVDFSEHKQLSDAVFAIAVHYDRLEKHEKAKQYYQYVLDHWPNHEHHAVWTIIHLARMNIELGDKVAAEVVIDGLVANLDADVPLYSYWRVVAAEAYCLAGSCYEQLGKHEEAIRCYEKVVNDYPDHRNAWLALSSAGDNYESLKELGGISEAEADMKIKAAYEQLLGKYPNCKAAEHAQRWLDQHNSR